MRQHSRFRPTFDSLESRWVPALLLQLDPSGNLTGIFGVPNGNVDLVFTADDEINVVEDANDLGTYSVPGNLTVSLGNTIASLTHTVDFDTFSFSGNLSVTLGNSTGVTTLELIDGGTVAGNVNIRTGNGLDVVNIVGVDIAGSLSISMAAGSDTAVLGSDTSVEGNFTGTGINIFTMEDIVVPATIAGHATLTTTENLGVLYQFFGNAITGNTSIGGNLVMRTGGGVDLVFLQNVVGGNVIANLGQGVNIFTQDAVSTILGNFSYTGGNGLDVVSLGSGGGSTLGNVTAVMGNGVNELNIDSTSFIGGSAITYIGGNGIDTLVFRGQAPGATLNARLGGGSDEFVLDDPTSSLARAFVDFGTGVDTFTNTFAIAFPITLLNL